MTTTAVTPTKPSDSTDLLLIVFCHVSSLLGVGILLPLIVYLIKRTESDIVAAHAREALNFHLSVLIYVVACFPLVFIAIGIPLLFVIGLGALALAIVGTVTAADGGFYRYPLTIRLVR